MESLKKASTNVDQATVATNTQNAEQQPMVIILTDIDSISVIEKGKKNDQYIAKDGTINQNGTIINQNYIEQYGRKQLAEKNEKYTEALYDIFTEKLGVDKEKLSKETFSLTLEDGLKENHGSLSNALLYVADKIEIKADDTKKLIDGEVWPKWANATTKIFFKDNKVQTNGKKFVACAKVGASAEALQELQTTLNVLKDNIVYLEGRRGAELYDYKKPEIKDEVPYIISSGEYTNHENKLSQLIQKKYPEQYTKYKKAKEEKTEKEFYENFFKGNDEKTESIKNDFSKYLQDTVDVRKQGINNAIQTVCPNITRIKLSEIQTTSNTEYIEQACKELDNCGKKQQAKQTGMTL